MGRFPQHTHAQHGTPGPQMQLPAHSAGTQGGMGLGTGTSEEGAVHTPPMHASSPTTRRARMATLTVTAPTCIFPLCAPGQLY